MLIKLRKFSTDFLSSEKVDKSYMLKFPIFTQDSHHLIFYRFHLFIYVFECCGCVVALCICNAVVLHMRGC